MSVASILKTKGQHVYAVEPEQSVLNALQLMAEKNIGALIVLSAGKLVGIMSERDYARKIILMGKASADTPVEEIMTRDPFTVAPSDSIETCMQLMSDKHIRHLPVMEQGIVVGMISVSDVVTRIITVQRDTIQHLQSYITQ